jgi:hypothetical protein
VPVSLVGLPDLNGNGSPELAVGPLAGEAMIRDSITKELLGTVAFTRAGLQPVDLAVVRDVSGEGYPELAALFRHPDGPAAVQLTDAATGTRIDELRFFGRDWDVTALTGIDRGFDGPDIAVLGSRKESLRGGIQLRDAVDDGTVERIHLPPDPARAYRDIAALEDVNGDEHPEIATLFDYADGTAKVVIKDGASGARINTVGFPGTRLREVGASAIGVTGIGDLSGDGSPDIAVLWRKANGQGVVQVRDARTGRWIHEMQFFGNAWTVVALTSLDSNLDGVAELAVLATKAYGTDVAVQIRDASSRQAVNWISFLRAGRVPAGPR